MTGVWTEVVIDTFVNRIVEILKIFKGEFRHLKIKSLKGYLIDAQELSVTLFQKTL